MTFLRARMSRRQALAVTALAACPLQAFADPPSSPRGPIMPPSIRLATPHDVPEIVALLTEDAQQRRSLDPLLWRIAPDAQARIERGVSAALQRTQAFARRASTAPLSSALRDGHLKSPSLNREAIGPPSSGC